MKENNRYRHTLAAILLVYVRMHYAYISAYVESQWSYYPLSKPETSFMDTVHYTEETAQYVHVKTSTAIPVQRHHIFPSIVSTHLSLFKLNYDGIQGSRQGSNFPPRCHHIDECFHFTEGLLSRNRPLWSGCDRCGTYVLLSAVIGRCDSDRICGRARKGSTHNNPSMAGCSNSIHLKK